MSDVIDDVLLLKLAQSDGQKLALDMHVMPTWADMVTVAMVTSVGIGAFKREREYSGRWCFSFAANLDQVLQLMQLTGVESIHEPLTSALMGDDA